MAELVLFNKPFQVLSQFTDDGASGGDSPRATLADYLRIPGIYAAGRLDYDSEGLLLLTAEGSLQHRIASPSLKMPKTYWVQVEGSISEEALRHLAAGVQLKDGLTRPAKADRTAAPAVWPRVPPVRHRDTIPTSWIELTITEGKNRQVRRMTAAVGFPTLRLIRYRIGDWTLDGLEPGAHRRVTVNLPSPPKPTRRRNAAGARTRRNRKS
ncbi:23S rRNA pseudouridine2457 synthase [Marinobacter sp. es.048]|uniref:pseudouridine synthase n=1 Tax=Marinobacter sp. es.048 TaxID=1761795 RepID=UPI000B589365|nr:pseudouridine synthase [Marinobacter sp. es.048]SNC67893.1 23S rRNA pseudouridine2457 synthase [Marinobacter sp. es.048]